MAFNNNSSTDLSRFSIGEIQDLSGVPNFYNAGSSKWLRSATATASSNLSATSKTNLAAAATATNPTVIMQGAISASYNATGAYASNPVARISASSVSVVPASYLNTTAVGVGVATAAGFQFVATGQTSTRTNSASTGTNGVVASNNTTIFSYCFTSATALSAYYTTNGTTWTAGTVTGIPTFATDSDTQAYASQPSTSFTVGGQNGWRRNRTTSRRQFAVFWCGARFVLIGPGVSATNYVVSLSTDGLAWGGDNTTAVVGATAQAVALNMQFYRNGNNCYLNIGTSYRYSTDGGVTWADSTFAAAPSPTTYFLQYNQSDPAKLIILVNSATTAYYSADSGATWSADRPFPYVTNGGSAYKGSTVVVSNANNSIQVSTDNGTTFVEATMPIGVLSLQRYLYVDANRFYLGVYNKKQILTSSDGVTWTLVTIPIDFATAYDAWAYGPNMFSFDSNTVVIYGSNTQSGYSISFSSTDGGVTWVGSQFIINQNSGFSGGSNVYTTPDAGGVAFCPGGANGSLTTDTAVIALKTDVTAGGAFYQTGSTVITPLRANSLAFVRVG